MFILNIKANIFMRR